MPYLVAGKTNEKEKKMRSKKNKISHFLLFGSFLSKCNAISYFLFPSYFISFHFLGGQTAPYTGTRFNKNKQWSWTAGAELQLIWKKNWTYNTSEFHSNTNFFFDRQKQHIIEKRALRATQSILHSKTFLYVEQIFLF